MVKTVGHARYSFVEDVGRRNVFGGDVDGVVAVDLVSIVSKIVEEASSSFCENSSSVWDVGGSTSGRFGGVGVDLSKLTPSSSIFLPPAIL